jgi:hypothetical protein
VADKYENVGGVGGVGAAGSISDSVIQIYNLLGLSGGSVAILALLRESKRLVETALSARSRRQITIKADGVTVELKGSNDVEDALRVFEQVASKREGSRKAPVNKQSKVDLSKGKKLLEAALGDKDALPHLMITADSDAGIGMAERQTVVSDGLVIEFNTLAKELGYCGKRFDKGLNLRSMI